MKTPLIVFSFKELLRVQVTKSAYSCAAAKFAVGGTSLLFKGPSKRVPCKARSKCDFEIGFTPEPFCLGALVKPEVPLHRRPM